MSRVPNEKAIEAKALYEKGLKLVDIAKQLAIPPGTIRRWKSTYKWDNERSVKKSERSHRKKGAQPGNKNSKGGPVGNRKAETHGFFSKYLPAETLALVKEVEDKNPLDILWENITIQYAAIIRSQQLMYVTDQDDMTKELIEDKCGTVSGERWEVQQAWDKQANFMAAQSRAMKTLESLIKQYDELLHKNWALATEEQKARIDVLRAKAQVVDGSEIADDGFLEALNGTAAEDWEDERD